MKIFIDSADMEEIKSALDGGICDGVTTNPSLIKAAVKKYGKPLDSYISEICRIVAPGPVSLEVVSLSYEDMAREGEILFKKFNAHKNVAIKVPVNPSVDGRNNFDGLKAIKALSSRGIPVNTTLIMTPEQALLAAKAGASFVSPFVGRIDDHIRRNAGMKFGKDDYFPAEGVGKSDNGIESGVDMVRKIAGIFRVHAIKCEILAASIRNVRQVREVAEAGAHIASVPYKVAEELMKHPKTAEGVMKFAEDTVEEYKNVFSLKK